jgi:hypothetical protein
MMRGAIHEGALKGAPERGTDLYPYHQPYQGEHHAISKQSASNQHSISVVPIWIAFSSSNGSPESS